MYTENNISISDFVHALSEAVDLVSSNLNNHHKKVAYMSYAIASEIKLSNDQTQDIILASLLHDISAFSIEEQIKMLQFESFDNLSNGHALLGYKLLKDFAPLSKVATLIRHHHVNYRKTQQDIPIGSYIIHLADKIAILLDDNHEVLQQVPEIRAKIDQNQEGFHPKALAAFNRLADTEAFWVEAVSPPIDAIMSKNVRFSKEIIDLETLRAFAKVFAHLIDFRSRFTATHSSGVAAVALELSSIDGFSERECKLMEIAGFLHDLGKLTVPNSILEKNGPLDDEEIRCMRKHTYYTHAILNKINGLGQIAAWASQHHERLDGSGYPFRMQGENISKLARIMAVADIVTAMTEDRPYRPGMERETVMKTLYSMSERGGIDKNIVELVNINFPRINEARIKAQAEAQQEYEAFHNDAKKEEPIRYIAPVVAPEPSYEQQRQAPGISRISGYRESVTQTAIPKPARRRSAASKNQPEHSGEATLGVAPTTRLKPKIASIDCKKA